MSAPFRGEHVGVFRGPNGWYVAAMHIDGVSHYQPASGGSPDLTIEQANREAREVEHEIAAQEAEEGHT